MVFYFFFCVLKSFEVLRQTGTDIHLKWLGLQWSAAETSQTHVFHFGGLLLKGWAESWWSQNQIRCCNCFKCVSSGICSGSCRTWKRGGGGGGGGGGGVAASWHTPSPGWPVTHPAEVEKGPGFLLNDSRKHDGRTRLGLTSDTSEGNWLPDYIYGHIREGTQDRELSGNANEGEQDIHPTTATLSIHTARKRPVQTKQDMKVSWQGHSPMLPWRLKPIKQRWTSLPV